VTTLTVLELVCFCEVFLLLSDISHYQLVNIKTDNGTMDQLTKELGELPKNVRQSLASMFSGDNQEGLSQLANLFNITEDDVQNAKNDNENANDDTVGSAVNHILVRITLIVAIILNVLLGLLTVLVMWCCSVEERRRRQRRMLRYTRTTSWWWGVVKATFTALLLFVMLVGGAEVPVVGLRTTAVLLLTYFGYLCVHVKLGEMIIWRMDMEKDSLDKEEILYKQLAVDDSEILVANFADK